MNHQLRKMETPHNQTTHKQTIHKQKLSEKKLNLKNLESIINGGKNTLPSLRNIKWTTVKTETSKIDQALTYISTNNIAELNELIYARAKLVCEKTGILSKSTKKNQNQEGNFDRNSDKKSTKTGKNNKTKEKRWNM